MIFSEKAEINERVFHQNPFLLRYWYILTLKVPQKVSHSQDWIVNHFSPRHPMSKEGSG